MKKVITYVALTFLLSSAGYYLIINSKALGLNPAFLILYLMWCPGISGMATSLIYERSLSGIGWKPGKLRWLGLGYFLPICYAAVAYGIIWLSGFGGINHDYRINAFMLIVLGPAISVVYAAGEEIGWRGFMLPQLYKSKGFTASCLITGIVWSVWHFPLIITGLYLAKMPMGPQLLLLLVTITAMTFAIGWLRLKSGSVWPAVLMHASHNFYIQWLFDPLTTETGPMSKYMIGESGIVLTVIFIGLAWVFWSQRGRLPSGIKSK
ncbi:MAG: type II CAAX endopeptidase family protein [Candidatus Omnitrophota bacterium]|jgi:membrane protease YdiL (CAAX protease family)